MLLAHLVPIHDKGLVLNEKLIEHNVFDGGPQVWVNTENTIKQRLEMLITFTRRYFDLPTHYNLVDLHRIGLMIKGQAPGKQLNQ